MGASCDSCESCSPQDERPVINMDVRNTDWADAVKKGNLTGMKILMHGDPELVNEPCDEYGRRALHFAVQNKNQSMITYLMEHKADINIQGGEDNNSLLHEAVLLQDAIAWNL